MLLIIGILCLLFSAALVALSAWKLDALIIIFALIGFTLIQVNNHSDTGHWDIIPIFSSLTLLGFLFYVINIYRIMERKFFDLIKPCEYKEFLDTNNLFYGYNKFIYHFPAINVFGTVGACMIVIVALSEG